MTWPTVGVKRIRGLLLQTLKGAEHKLKRLDEMKVGRLIDITESERFICIFFWLRSA